MTKFINDIIYFFYVQVKTCCFSIFIMTGLMQHWLHQILKNELFISSLFKFQTK
jgi:hypothetical protein